MNKFFDIMINKNDLFVIIVYLIFYINFMIYNNHRVKHFFILNFCKLNFTSRCDNIKRYKFFITSIITSETLIILNFNVLFRLFININYDNKIYKQIAFTFNYIE